MMKCVTTVLDVSRLVHHSEVPSGPFRLSLCHQTFSERPTSCTHQSGDPTPRTWTPGTRRTSLTSGPALNPGPRNSSSMVSWNRSELCPGC
ncbi:unnamed protein product, partial [Candidula unifasciata]